MGLLDIIRRKKVKTREEAPQVWWIEEATIPQGKYDQVENPNLARDLKLRLQRLERKLLELRNKITQLFKIEEKLKELWLDAASQSWVKL